MILLKPVDDIMEKLGITPYTLGLSDDHDEFFRLNSALDSLTAQVSEVHSVLHEKEQLVRERLLLGILHASVDVTALPQEYMKYGLVFPYRFFSLILIHMPALEIMEDFTKKSSCVSLSSPALRRHFPSSAKPTASIQMGRISASCSIPPSQKQS